MDVHIMLQHVKLVCYILDLWQSIDVHVIKPGILIIIKVLDLWQNMDVHVNTTPDGFFSRVLDLWQIMDVHDGFWFRLFRIKQGIFYIEFKHSRYCTASALWQRLFLFQKLLSTNPFSFLKLLFFNCANIILYVCHHKGFFFILFGLTYILDKLWCLLFKISRALW